jgi:hypothetical protein
MDKDLWAIVMERFPKLPKERECRLEKEMRDAARQSYYERLFTGNTSCKSDEQKEFPVAVNGKGIGI